MQQLKLAPYGSACQLFVRVRPKFGFGLTWLAVLAWFRLRLKRTSTNSVSAETSCQTGWNYRTGTNWQKSQLQATALEALRAKAAQASSETDKTAPSLIHAPCLTASPCSPCRVISLVCHPGWLHALASNNDLPQSQQHESRSFETVL